MRLGDRDGSRDERMKDTGRQDALTIEQIIDIKTPEGPVWSPDGSHLAYRLAGFGYGEIFLSELSGAPRQLTGGDLPAGEPVWDGNDTLLFLRGRRLQRAGLHGAEETLLELPENATRASLLPDGSGAVYVRDGDAWLQELDSDEPSRMTEGQWLMTRMSHRLLDLLTPSPNGRHVAILAPQEQGINLCVYSRDSGELSWIAPSDDIEAAPVWSPDGSRLAFTRCDWEVKWRELYVTTPDGKDPVQLWRDESERWVSRFQFDCAFSDDGEQIAFVAPRNNVGQLFVAPSGGGSAVAVSQPDAECESPVWSPDGTWIAYVGNQPERPRGDQIDWSGLTEKGLKLVSPDGTLLRDVVEHPCVVSEIAWSPDSRQLAVVASTTREPNQILLCDPGHVYYPPAGPFQPENLGWPTEVQVSATRITSEDGEWKIPILIMKRKDLPWDGSAPGIIHIHGGGQGQFVLAGWGGYTHRGQVYATNLLLAQQGYVVIDVDYRGSWGYGRDYETASYLDVGGGDMRDVIAAARWLGKRPEVDPARIGLWGRSYGGYMTTLCMVREPEMFAAGVNVVGVFNWVDYYNYLSDRSHGAWSRSRFERPEDHPELYDERNPLNDVDKLAAPYLALYGNDDANVPIDHCWQMVRALTDAGKRFDMVVYPDEPHIFTRKETWRDALTRITEFFDQHLKGERSGREPIARHLGGLADRTPLRR